MTSGAEVDRSGISTNVMVVAGLALAAMLWQAPRARAQDQEKPAAAKGQESRKTANTNPDRRKALELSYQHRDLEALPLLESLAKADLGDREVLERLAVSLVSKSATVSREEGAAVLRRARAILLDLQKSGPISDLSAILADGLPADSRPPTFSTHAEAQTAMREGESAFARRDFDVARRAYQRALALDPHLYTAALFVGDTYFVQGQFPQARAWFTRAVLIDPDKETAHRYLGDAQSKVGNSDSARVSYLDAVLAEPYKRAPWSALAQWGKENQVTLSHPEIVPTELEDKPNNQNLAEKPSAPDDGRSHWHRYTDTRAVWAKSRFKATFPEEKAYRHSLAEEADSLRQVAQTIAADVKAGKIKEPHPSFANLIKLEGEGLLDAYVLYARPDQGISTDYANYRATHRGELRRYLAQYVAPERDIKAPAREHP